MGGGQLIVQANPDSLYRAKGTRAASTSITTSEPSVVSVTGGAAPFAYAWSKIAGDLITPNSPAAASTFFGGTVDVDTTAYATFKCVVTDAFGATGETGPVAVSLSAIPFGNGDLL